MAGHGKLQLPMTLCRSRISYTIAHATPLSIITVFSHFGKEFFSFRSLQNTLLCFLGAMTSMSLRRKPPMGHAGESIRFRDLCQSICGVGFQKSCTALPISAGDATGAMCSVRDKQNCTSESKLGGLGNTCPAHVLH